MTGLETAPAAAMRHRQPRPGVPAHRLLFWALCGALTAAVLGLQVSGWLGWLIDRALVWLLIGVAVVAVYGWAWIR